MYPVACSLYPRQDAHEKFLKVTRAYEVLKDEEQRKKYDMFGDEVRPPPYHIVNRVQLKLCQLRYAPKEQGSQ